MMCDPDAPKADFDSDHPDKSQACYPCSCPDCPGFHECGYIYARMSHGDVFECTICGQITRYNPLTTGTADRIVSTFSHPELARKMREKMNHMLENNFGGSYTVVRPRTDNVTTD